MHQPPLIVNDRAVPRLLYGTAWKEQATQSLTEMALSLGFRGIDTANQRRHYYEAGVGEGITASIAAGLLSREDLFLQTKFTFRGGQDHRLPYDPEARIAEQVEQSFASSLRHLRTEWVDSYLLHGPTQTEGLSSDDWEAWQAIEAIHHSGRARMIGVSNFTASQLQLLLAEARVRPMIVQNRCFAADGWDRKVRELCRAHGMLYQGFSLLTANRQALAHPTLADLAADHKRTIPQIVFRFAIEIGMVPLTGTTTASHMREDLRSFDFQLTPDQIAAIEDLVSEEELS